MYMFQLLSSCSMKQLNTLMQYVSIWHHLFVHCYRPIFRGLQQQQQQQRGHEGVVTALSQYGQVVFLCLSVYVLFTFIRGNIEWNISQFNCF